MYVSAESSLEDLVSAAVLASAPAVLAPSPSPLYDLEGTTAYARIFPVYAQRPPLSEKATETRIRSSKEKRMIPDDRLSQKSTGARILKWFRA